MNIVVSACLLGVNCRYCGDHCLQEEILALQDQYHIIPVCPEVLGGLPTPRVASEIVGDKVITKEGQDVTDAFYKGAKETLKIAQSLKADYAILKKNSPSCGYGQVYDGSFSGQLVAGNGVAAQCLSNANITIMNELNYKEILQKEIKINKK